VPNRRDTGYTSACIKGSNSAYALEPDEYKSLLADWMAGKAFWTGRAYHGDTVTIKLGQIEAVIRATPEGQAASRAEDDENRTDDMVMGAV
jgi:hypothetical protein